MKKLLFLVMSVSPMLAKAQAFATGYVGDKQNAMGGAGTGLALDAASMNLNPASISFLQGNSVSVGGAAAVTNTAYLDANNNSLTKTSNPIGTPFHANFVYGVKDSSSALSKFKFGLGVTTPYGGNIKYPSDWTGNNAIISKTLTSIVVAPTASYKITNKLSIGASFIYSVSTLKLETAVASASLGSTSDLNFSQRGYGFAGGIYYKPTSKLSIGLGYVSQVNSKSYKGTATFNVPSSIASQFPTGNATFNSSVPQGITLGGGYEVTDKLLFALDVTYSMWSCFKTTTFNYSAATPASAVQSTVLPNNYKDVFTVGLGSQYKITDQLTARAGVSYNQTPVPTNYIYPDVPDGDRLNLSAGVSYKITKSFSADVSYKFTDIMKTTTTNVSTNMNGTYKTYAHMTGLTLNYNF